MLKSTQALTEDEWMQELDHIKNEVTHVRNEFNMLEEILRLGDGSDDDALAVFNATPLFWSVVRDCLQESMFMGVGRLCDSAPDAISVRRIFSAATQHPEFFSEQALRRRLQDRNLAKDLADRLIERAWMPKAHKDFSYLKKAISCHLDRIKQIYKPIRNSHYGHRLMQEDIHAMLAKTNRQELAETLDALYELTVVLWNLYHNGPRPEIGALDFKASNDNVKGYVRSVVGKLAGSAL